MVRQDIAAEPETRCAMESVPEERASKPGGERVREVTSLLEDRPRRRDGVRARTERKNNRDPGQRRRTRDPGGRPPRGDFQGSH